MVKIARALEQDSNPRDPGLGWLTADLANKVQAQSLWKTRATCHCFVLLDYREIENAAISRVEVIHHRITYYKPQSLPLNCYSLVLISSLSLILLIHSLKNQDAGEISLEAYRDAIF